MNVVQKMETLADPILAVVSRVPSEFVAAVKATIEELKRQVGYADWTLKKER